MITIMKVLEVRNNGLPNPITGEVFEKHGLPIYGGCELCGAGIAAYNAYPSRTGFIRCKNCIGDEGFDSVPEFEAHIEELADDEE